MPTAARTTTTRATRTAFDASGGEASSPKLFLPPPLTLESLFDAYFDARRTKRHSRAQLAFEIDLERNLLSLWRDLTGGSYTIGPTTAFVVTRPKVREVWAADFRDRIVHHLIYNALAPYYHPRFIRDSYACIPGRGIHDGMSRIGQFARSLTCGWTKQAYALKVDVANFFGSIDRMRLLELLEAHVAPGWCLDLVRQIILHDPRRNALLNSPKELFDMVPRHKSLLHAPAGFGLPIGNLTSQFFANVYMNELDQFAKHRLKARYYGRYVDDMVLLHQDADVLNHWCKEIDAFLLDHLRLRLHPSKIWLNRADAGIDFVGFVIKPGRVYLRRSTVAAAHARLSRWERQGSDLDERVLSRIACSLTSTLGMLRAVDGYTARRKLSARANGLFLRADEACTKIWAV